MRSSMLMKSLGAAMMSAGRRQQGCFMLDIRKVCALQDRW
jgi:hypothetical protein